MLAEKKIRKHVSIIHAYSLMSMLQRKIVNVLLYEAIKGNKCQQSPNSVAVECNIPFSILSKAINFNSNNNQYLKEAVDGLASLKIEWNLLKDKTQKDISFLNLRILHGSPTFYKDNTLNFSFHKVMLELVTNPGVYGTIDVDLQSEFESKYSHALYENSTRFINLQKSKIIQLDTFRKILGVQEDKYINIRELTRNVITPSIEEVNERSDFFVKLETMKNGRKTIGFEVSIKSKKKSVTYYNDVINTNQYEVVKKEIHQEFGVISQSVLDNILNNYPEEYILEKIAYTKKYSKKENSGFYPIPYFISAIKHDYKFKEVYQSQSIEENVLDESSEWNKKLILLQSDLRHWEDRLSLANSSQKESDIKVISSIVENCQEKITQHHLGKPKMVEAS
ncbi:MAG: replication initiation protein [Gammaproteobacteria bacterium]|nr:replication initiation protein [Gammaproteobacteria bacterium]